MQICDNIFTQNTHFSCVEFTFKKQFGIHLAQIFNSTFTQDTHFSCLEFTKNLFSIYI